jgi:hypothetical protein
MPYEIRFAGDIMAVRFFGTVSAQDMRQCLGEVEAIEATHARAPHRITDLSDCETALLDFALLEEITARRRATRLKNTVQSAIYAPSEVQFGFSRMFQTLNDNPLIAIKVTRDRAEAEAWLADGRTSRPRRS